MWGWLDREFCERLKTNDFQKELKKQKAKSAMDYAVKCTASSTEKGWKKMNCAKYTSLFQCNFFENTAKILDNSRAKKSKMDRLQQRKCKYNAARKQLPKQYMHGKQILKLGDEITCCKPHIRTPAMGTNFA